MEKKDHVNIYKVAMEKFVTLKEISEEIFSIPNPIGNKRGIQLMYELDTLANDIIVNYIDKHYTLEKKVIKDQMAYVDTVKKKVNIVLLAEFIIAVIVTVFLSSRFIRSILRPVLEFEKGARIIGGGNLAHRINIRDGLEITSLADEFNDMAKRLMESYNILEKKVQERTKKLNELNKILEKLSITDGLTDLYNHKHFHKKLKEEVKKAKRYNFNLSLIIADIDYFKNYNDAHGHMEGDKILKGVASSIMSSVRTHDVTARYGGEEFSIILPNTNKNDAMRLAERIRLNISKQPFPYKETQPNGNLTISLGVASFPEDVKEPDNLIKKADDALYRAKEKGRNRVEVI
jgi:diguanylate cyclase (GGDEF)-like protein